MISPPPISIINTDIEGECRIKSLHAIRMNPCKLFFFILLTIMTIGIIALFTKWFIKFQKWLLYESCNLNEATHLFVQNNDETYEIISLISSQNDKLFPYFFINRHLKYVFNNEIKAFKAAELDFPANISQKEFLEKYSNGISNKEKLNDNQFLFGKCLIEIPLPGLGPYLFEELSNPFFILQYISCAIWIVEGFFMFAIILIAVSVVLTLMNFVFLYLAKKKLKTLAEQQISIKVLRKGAQNLKEFEVVSSSELVPGDVFILEDQISLPCDCVLIAGDSLMNESMLTGESIPTPKFPLDYNINDKFDFNTCKRNILYEGTKVLQIKAPKEGYVLALVLRTGFTSIKGQMIRTILFPKAIQFSFNKQGVKYIISLAVICFSLYFVTLAEMIRLDLGTQLYVLRFLDVVTWVIPPALPIFMTLAITVAVIRLRIKGIIGLNPHSVLLAGKVNVCCFDKTGTITSNGIDVHEVYQVENGSLKEISCLKNEERIHKITNKIMACCHSAYLINDALIGDLLDISMLEFSLWKYQISNDPEIKFQAIYQSSALEVLKVFEFSSELQRMSVFVRDRDLDKYFIFSKGAPEKIRNFSRESTISQDFADILECKSIQGFRILGLAYKELAAEEKNKVLSMSREEIENDLIFIGFLVLENKLKIDSRHCLTRLNEANIQIKLISGDNILTTIQTAKEAGILCKESDVIICDITENLNRSQLCLKILKAGLNSQDEKKSMLNNNNNNSSIIKNNKISVEMEPFDTRKNSPRHMTRINSLAFSSTKELLSHLELIFANNADDYEYAISGPAYTFFEKASLEKQGSAQIAEIFSTVFQKAKVLARMKPEQKAFAVLKLQKLGHTVCMTGDGANDCGALKQADIGVSFSETDASFSAPFTSTNTSINCVEKVLLEGRATIVNSVEIFRYYLTVSFLKFFGIWLLVFSASNLNDFQWTYINYLNSIISLVFVSLGKPLNYLSKEKPPDNLIGLENLFSIYGIMTIGALGEATGYIMLRNEDWFNEPAVLVDGNYRMEGVSNTTVFYCMNIFYISALVTFVISIPFKQRLFRNYVLTVWLILCFVYNSLLIFYPEQLQIPTLYLVELEETFKGKLFGALIGFSCFMFIYEEIFCKKIIRRIENKKIIQ